MATGKFLGLWKHATVSPHLKRPGLDLANPANYHPVSNLPFLSKFLERIANKQLVAHLVANRLLPWNQSANRRKGHFTETAILKTFDDIVNSVANGEVALLCLLDLTSAFDTVDHHILLYHLTT